MSIYCEKQELTPWRKAERERSAQIDRLLRGKVKHPMAASKKTSHTDGRVFARALKRLKAVFPGAKPVGGDNRSPWANAAYLAFRAGSITKRQGRALGCVFNGK